MYFQAIDDKNECIGVYADGQLHFDEMPESLLRTWKYSGSLVDEAIEYAWLYCGGGPIEKGCPPTLQPTLRRLQSKMSAYKKSFELAKIDFRDHCFFDLVPHDFLLEFLEVKNQITKHVFENFEKPGNYDHLDKAQKLVHKIRHQKLNISNEGCRKLFVSSVHRGAANKILKGSPYIDYNLFGTVTGRLATVPGSFPILTMNRQLRKLIKPRNDWFLSLDYNGAEIRTFLALSGKNQPQYDIHMWNIDNIFKNRAILDRSEAKTLLFSWLYNHDSKDLDSKYYNREDVVKEYYEGGYVQTIAGRKIKVDERRAFNYIIQSTTADLVMSRAIEIDRFLEDKKSFVSHIVHDEIVIDLSNDEKDLVPEIKEIFSNNILDKFVVNMEAGTNYYDLEDLRL